MDRAERYRREALENAVATNRLEGLEPDPRTVAELEQAEVLRRVRERIAAGEFRTDSTSLDRTPALWNEPLTMTEPRPPREPILSRPTGDDWRRLRERHGLTQNDLAALVYRSPEAVKKWEQDRGGGDLACWHLALLLLGELGRKKRRMKTRIENGPADDENARH